MSGCCATCGVEFSVEDNISNLIGRSAVADYLRYRAENPDDVLADFTPIGKPN